MKIAVLRTPGQFEITEEPVPQIEPGEVLVRVAACGVCTSELDQWEGKVNGLRYPHYPGHEVSGVVERAGREVEGVRPGDRVAVWVTGRGYAEYIAVKAEYCFPVGDVPLEQALAEPLACAVNTVELADPALGDDVLLIGAGFMGSLVQQLAALRGPRQLIVADTRPDVLERARQMGATHVVNVLTDSLPEVVRELTGGQGVDISFEVTGAQAPLQMLGDVTRMSGKLVIVGFHQGGLRQIPLAHWNWMAFQIINAHFRELSTILRGMRIGLRLLNAGRLSLDGLVSHRFGLADINQAFRIAQEKPEGFIKSVIQM